MGERRYTVMKCSITGLDEPQYVVKETEDGITLRCEGCGKHHSHEIGFFAHLYHPEAEG